MEKAELTTEQDASRCCWLKLETLVNVGLAQQVQEIPSSDLRVGPLNPQRIIVQVPILQGRPTLATVCTHQELLTQTRERLPVDLRGQVSFLLTSLPVCRMCSCRE